MRKHSATALLGEFQALAGERNVFTKAETVEKLSKDFYWYSPLLAKQLKDKKAEVGIRINQLATLKKIVSLCCRKRIPIQVRGAGTGNYGQLIPLHGGVILDLGGMNGIHSLGGGVARVEPGARLGTIETEARKKGWELRCLPSTWVKSSMGGFLCGGSLGIGSITWGGVNFRDNVKSITLLSIEEDPRLLKFEERDCIKATHTYGTTGILVEAEVRLGGKVPYDQHLFSCPDWDTLLDWTWRIACDGSLRKRLAAQFEWPIPSYFLPLRKYMPEGHHGTILLVDKEQSAAVMEEAKRSGVRHAYTIPHREPLRPPYLTDYTWNHTTLWAIKKDASYTYLQLGLEENFRDQIRTMGKQFPGEIIWHLEFTRGNAKMRNEKDAILCGGLPLVRYTGKKRLYEIIDACREIGMMIANPHEFTLEEGGIHPDIAEKRALKSEVDPFGILNPGKMKTYPHNPFA